MTHKRIEDLKRLYDLLRQLEKNIGGTTTLSHCHGGDFWPKRGVYFFYEVGQNRSHTGKTPRVVRVGTHALKKDSKTTLWKRLSQHKGQKASGGGNHRGSIFRLIIGTALIKRDGLVFPTWGKGSSAPSEIRKSELPLEKLVSEYVGLMPFLWLEVEDPPGPKSFRGYIERNAIALLSNYGRTPTDPPSTDWLGEYCDRTRVRQSGLWNSNHVDEYYDPNFLDILQTFIKKQGRIS